MTKADLLDLIVRLDNAWRGSAIASMKAREEETETITAPGVLPLLREIIAEQEGESDAQKDVRRAAYFIYGRVLEGAFTPADCAFLLERLEVETDRNLLHRLLEHIRDLHDRAGIVLPPELDTTTVRRLARSDQGLIRHSALRALAACPGPESQELLADRRAKEEKK